MNHREIKKEDLRKLESDCDVWEVECPGCKYRGRVDVIEIEKSMHYCMNCHKDYKIVK